MFPQIISSFVSSLPYTVDSVGRSDDTVYVFENKYILKVSRNTEMLRREAERFDFLTQNGIPGSKTVCYTEKDGCGYYLREYLCGESLISERYLSNPDLLTDALAIVVGVLRSLDKCGCDFYSTDNKGTDFVHGDLCLPNIYMNKDGSFAGFIDLSNAGLGDKWYDYAWMLWSLEYNLGTDRYNGTLLEKIGVEFDREWFERYIPEEYRGMRL